MNSVCRVEGRPPAHLQLALLRAYGRVTRSRGCRGMQPVTWRLGRLFAPRNAAWLRTDDGAVVRIRLGDGYWARLLDAAYRYEPELHAALDRLVPDADFLDCGANIGYWSAIASRSAHAVAAVEASAHMFGQLTVNANANGAFAAVHAAVWDRSGETLDIVSHLDRHAGASVVNRAHRRGTRGYFSEPVQTRCIDDLVQQFFPDPQRPLVIKLDVEGAEIAALDGATAVFGTRAVSVLYEDHGQDPQQAVSKHLAGMGLTLRDAATGTPLSLDAIAERKVDRSVGYNFLATA